MVMMPLSLVRLMEEYAQVEMDDGCFKIIAQDALLMPCSCECSCENAADDNDVVCEKCRCYCLCPCGEFYANCECKSEGEEGD